MTSKARLDTLLATFEQRWPALLRQNVQTLRSATTQAEDRQSWSSFVDTWFEIPTSIIEEYGRSVVDWRRTMSNVGSQIEETDHAGDVYRFSCQEDADRCTEGWSDE